MKHLNTLLSKKLISEKQFSLLSDIEQENIISVYYEIRTLLYLGILLFTGGIGYIAYENIGEIGHLAAIGILLITTILGFVFIQKKALPFSFKKAEVQSPYFDYLVLLVALLSISTITYVQVYFNIVESLLTPSSFLAAIILFFISYRYDNKAVLSLAITAFTAAFGLSISPVDWAKGELINTEYLNYLSLGLGAFLVAIGSYSELKNIKKHFSFTYHNFGLLIFYLGVLSGLFSTQSTLFSIIGVVIGIAVSIYTWKNSYFLFFLYSNIVDYICLTYLLFSNLGAESFLFLIYYIPFSCIGYIVFLISNKSHFKRD